MYFDIVDIVGPITDIETIAAGPAGEGLCHLRRESRG